MKRNKDRWSALSMKDRAALIDIYVKSGITDLGEMRKDYNSFGDGGDIESPVDGGEIEASIITPRQSRINKRRMRKELFTKIKSTLESDGDIIQLYNSLPEDQRKRTLESIMKFSSAADPKIVKDWFIEEAKKHPLKAIKALDYVITGNGQPVLFEPNRKYAYNGLFGGDYYFDKQTPIDNGIVDAMLYNREINSAIGVQSNKEDFGPEIDYINRVYPNKNVQYIETRPGTNLNQEGIQPTIYYGAQGSFKTSLPKRVINNQGIIIQEGIRNDSTFVRGLDVYDFKPDEYISKWVGDSSMLPVIKQIDEDTNPVAVKTPWVYKDDINDIISSRTGLNDFEFNTIDSNKSVYKTQKAFGGKLNKFSTGGPIGEGTATYNHPKYNHKEEAAIYSYLRERGVPHTQTSAIMGNIAVESMLDPHISQIGGGGGYGLIQATDQPRKNNFINYDGQPYEFGSELDPETQRQLDYIIDKGLNDYTIGEWRKVGKSGARNVRKEFLKESDITKASDLFTKGYLRPGKPHTKRRQSMSKYFNDNYGEVERQLNSFSDAFLFK